MQEWLSFLKSQLSDADARAVLPIDRMKVLDFEWLPENREQFEMMIAGAPPTILEGLGFIRYSTLPVPYRESQQKINNLVGDGFDLFLFPAEWYQLIPNGFSVININSEVITFEPGNTDDTVRAGCLSYGVAIRVPL